MALNGLFKEATAEDDKALQRVLEEYEAMLKEDPSNIVSLTHLFSFKVVLMKIACFKTSNRSLEDTRKDSRCYHSIDSSLGLIAHRR